MLQLDLDENERSILKMVLESYLSDLRMEIGQPCAKAHVSSHLCNLRNVG